MDHKIQNSTAEMQTNSTNDQKSTSSLNLTMVDDGAVTDRPTRRATNVVIDGSENRVEGFHMTIKGSWPYGYGDCFGKGGTDAVIKHYKHSALLIRGTSNHVKNCTLIHSLTYSLLLP